MKYECEKKREIKGNKSEEMIAEIKIDEKRE